MAFFWHSPVFLLFLSDTSFSDMFFHFLLFSFKNNYVVFFRSVFLTLLYLNSILHQTQMLPCIQSHMGWG